MSNFSFNSPGASFNVNKIEDKKTRVGTVEQLPGFYRARVEYNRDPKGLGRVKVRIPQLHGTDTKELPTSSLPWAFPGDFSCAGYDFGEFKVPPVGTLVWVAFEAGDADKPIYFGGIPFSGGQPKQYNQVGEIPKNNPDYMGKWSGGSGLSAPKEIYNGRNLESDVTRNTLYKSPKGATIYIDDTDGKESISIVDRAGQIIKMMSPVPSGNNQGNKSQRGLKNAIDGNQIKVPGSKIIVKTGDSTMEMELQKILLKVVGSTITMDPGSIIANIGGSTISMDPGNINLNIGGSYVHMDGGQIKLSLGSSTITMSSNSITIDAPSVSINP